ncbi:MAG TPA: PAS domain S-box protein [Holophagaceae bacterium]|nr:PAS domain S-box protein [Holophagaceae bacterium]
MSASQGPHSAFRLQAEMEALRNTLERLASGTPLNRFLEDLCLSLEGLLEEGRCSVLRLDEQGKVVRHCAGPSLPAPYMALIDGSPIGPKAGSCGTAMHLLKPVVVEDIASDPLWEDYRAAALPHGLKACASIPIVDPQGHALGAFAIYHAEPGPFEPSDLATLQRFTDIASLAIRISQRDERLRTEELRHRALVEHSGDGIFYFDAENGVILEANPAFHRILGYGTGELEGRNLVEIVGHDPASVKANIEATLAKGSHSLGERNYRRKDGTLIPVEVSAAALDLGSHTIFSVIARDVGDRNRAQEALRLSEARLQEAHRLGKLGHWSFDLGTGQITWSDTVYQIFDRDPALGPPSYAEYLALLHPEERAGHEARVAAAMAGQGHPSFDLRTLTSDGRIRWHRGQMHPVITDGKVTGLYGVAQDITDQKEAEARLEHAARDLKAIMDQASDGIFVADGTTRYLDANRRALEMVGYTHAELTQLGIRDLIPPEERDQLPDRVQALESGRPYLVERTLVRKDGSRFCAEISARKLEDGRYLSICRDVTERREAEARLRQAAQDLDEAQDLGHLGSWALELSTGQVRWSSTMYRILGRDPALGPLDTQAGERFFDPDGTRGFRASLERMISEGGGEEGIFTVEVPGQGRRFFRSTIRAVSEEGRVVALRGILQDITEREEALRRQARSEASFRHLFDLNPAPMVLSRPSDGTILLANASAYRLFQLTPSEVERKRTVDFFAHPEDRQRLLAELADHGTARDFSLEMVVHGEHRQILLSAAMPDYLGEKAILVALTDITDRAREEESQRQAQKLESLGLLAGGIAHDFNNLLTSLLGNLGLAQLHLPDQSTAAPYLSDMETVIQRAADLARQMLAYSGRGKFRQEPVDINHLVREMTHLLSVGIPKRIQLNLDLDPGLPRVQGDPVQLQQVVMNLVTNASEAIGDQNGSIRIRTERRRLDAQGRAHFAVGRSLPDGDYLCIEVEDSGAGMSPEVLARIFDPFFTTKATGRGLGMSALMGILTGHKAGLSIETALAKGTRFRVWFSPLEDDAGHGTAASASAPTTSYRGRVLVVDDEASVRASAGALLRHLGFEVEEAADGQVAVERLAELDGSCDLVLLDLTMPRMDGREALGHLRARWPWVPVILSSGYSEQAGTLDLGGPGAYLPKPYRVADLKEALAKALGR